MATEYTPTYEMNPNATGRNDNGLGAGGWGAGLIGGIIGFALGGAAGGGLLGRNGAANANTVIGLTNEGLNLAMQRDLNQIAREQSGQLCNGFQNVNNGISGINLGMCQGFGALTHQIDMGFCDVKQTIHSDGMTTRALINDLETQRLREKLLAAENALSNANQTAAIVNSLRPYPTPAFIAPNPAVPFADGFHGFGHKHFA